MAYTDMLYQSGISREVHRTYSKSGHLDLPAFQVMSIPNLTKIAINTAPSFIYGNPLLGLKCLCDVERNLLDS
jgi:hypothetical protein